MVLFCATTLSSFAQQADMPTIIVFPDDVWMRDNGYMTEFNNDGKIMRLPKYADAFATNREIGTAIQAVQKVFEDRGFRHEDLQGVLKGMDTERAVEMARQSKGKGTETGLMEEILQQANPDIRIDLDYAVKQFGPRKNIEFKLKAVDAYCYEQVAACEGVVEGTMDPTSLALRKVIAGKSEDFCQQIINYFMDLRDNGRKITVIFRAGEGTGIDFLNDEIGPDDDVYSDFLHAWLRKHAVHKSASMGRQTESLCEFKNVRIPFFDNSGEPQNARRWARGIIKAFKAETGIKIKNDIGSGMGLVNFRIGIE